jgi:3-polyprenyl-4-hydroxybenzoate decarboxylase
MFQFYKRAPCCKILVQLGRTPSYINVSIYRMTVIGQIQPQLKWNPKKSFSDLENGMITEQDRVKHNLPHQNMTHPPLVP